VNYAVQSDAAEALVAEISTAGGRAIAVAADVADSAAVEAMVARTEAELGPVTILVNNAGVSWQGTLDTYDPEQVARMRRVNVDGVIHATRAVTWTGASAPSLASTSGIPGMDDGIAAGKRREPLRSQQAMGIGNRANGSHHARPDYKRSRVRREPML
jgi:NAD(P)-dependent dehydrogenase (short-subunit alcohol dehydrogenase family)